MTDLPERPTLERLQAARDDDLIDLVLDWGLRDLIGFERDQFEASLPDTPKTCQIMYASMELHWEVMNGGLFQYFFNTQGRLSALALEGLRYVGANESVAAFEKAIEVFAQETQELEDESSEDDDFPDVEDLDAFVRSAEGQELIAGAYAAGAEQSKLGELDDPFFSEEQDLDTLWTLHIRNNIGQFAAL